MHRDELQRIAIEKYEDAEILFSRGRHSNSYYLFGYAAEVALKARLSRVFTADTIPDKKFVSDIYTHDLKRLIALSGLAEHLESERKREPQFDAYWSTVTGWSESVRYDIVDASRATAMRNAMTNEVRGVFQWLTKHW
jgi:HEPN domain-containing protein